MNQEEYKKTRQFIERKALNLMAHEEKGHIKSAFPQENYTKYVIEGRTFYCVKTNSFKAIIEDYLVRAQGKYPEKFGTGNAIDVIEALYLINPIMPFEDFKEFLKNEQFAYVIESKDGEIIDKILRIDLYRHLVPSKVNPESGNYEFVGGILHAFRHFSINGINLSTGNEIHNIDAPECLLKLATKAFFMTNQEQNRVKSLVSRIDLDDKYYLKVAFFLEEESGVYFINTSHKELK